LTAVQPSALCREPDKNEAANQAAADAAQALAEAAAATSDATRDDALAAAANKPITDQVIEAVNELLGID